MLDVAKVWLNVKDRIGFYTKETYSGIPDSPGIYGWFVPLWLYYEDIDQFSQAVHRLFSYDTTSGGKAYSFTTAKFGWERIAMKVSKYSRPKITSALRTRWKEMLQNADLRNAFERAMMEASLLMPPLYIGKADSLSTRYKDHIDERTDFSRRFRKYSKELPSQLSYLQVSDLLFVCIQFDPKISKVIREAELNYLLEQVVMRLVRPSFSVK